MKKCKESQISYCPTRGKYREKKKIFLREINWVMKVGKRDITVRITKLQGTLSNLNQNYEYESKVV